MKWSTVHPEAQAVKPGPVPQMQLAFTTAPTGSAALQAAAGELAGGILKALVGRGRTEAAARLKRVSAEVGTARRLVDSLAAQRDRTEAERRQVLAENPPGWGERSRELGDEAGRLRAELERARSNLARLEPAEAEARKAVEAELGPVLAEVRSELQKRHREALEAVGEMASEKLTFAYLAEVALISGLAGDAKLLERLAESGAK